MNVFLQAAQLESEKCIFPEVQRHVQYMRMRSDASWLAIKAFNI